MGFAMSSKLYAWLLLFLISSISFPTNGAVSESSPASDSFFQQTRAEVETARRKRDGLAILLDRRTGESYLFGNGDLLKRKFLPGSLMKLITAELALLKGKMPNYECTGHDRIGGKKMHCWTYKGHGPVDFSRALSLSCNLYFASLGGELGWQALAETLRGEGFSEAAALEQRTGTPDQAARLAIGDHPAFRASPEEMMVFWNRYLKKISDPSFSVISQALRRSVTEGTGQKAGSATWEILGKTGTSDSQTPAYKTDGWFLGAYPAEQPRWALLVFLKQAHGFDEAADLAGRIFSIGVKTGYFEDSK